MLYAVAVCGCFAPLVAAASTFVGTWDAKINDLPGIELTIKDDATSKVNGEIVFFFQRRGEDGKWRVEGEPARGPLIDPKVTGKFLTFEVRHHKQHGGPEWGPNVKYRLELTGDDELTFRNPEGKPENGPSIKLRRRKI